MSQIEKYIDDKLVRLINITISEVSDMFINDTEITMILKDGRIFYFRFDTYEHACEGLELIKSKLEPDWQEEFEDKIQFVFEPEDKLFGITFTDKQLFNLCGKYLNCLKVKVKCKDGAILIERIEE